MHIMLGKQNHNHRAKTGGFIPLCILIPNETFRLTGEKNRKKKKIKSKRMLRIIPLKKQGKANIFFFCPFFQIKKKIQITGREKGKPGYDTLNVKNYEGKENRKVK